MTPQEDAINRIRSAVQNGIKATKIAALSNITYFRISSVISPDSYRGSTKFTDHEIKEINKALNKIKNSI